MSDFLANLKASVSRSEDLRQRLEQLDRLPPFKLAPKDPPMMSMPHAQIGQIGELFVHHDLGYKQDMRDACAQLWHYIGATHVQRILSEVRRVTGSNPDAIFPPSVQEKVDQITEKWAEYMLRFQFGDWAERLLTKDEADEKYPNFVDEGLTDHAGVHAIDMFVVLNPDMEKSGFYNSFTLFVTAFKWVKGEDDLLYRDILEQTNYEL